MQPGSTFVIGQLYCIYYNLSFLILGLGGEKMFDWEAHFDFVSFIFFGEPKHPLLEE